MECCVVIVVMTLCGLTSIPSLMTVDGEHDKAKTGVQIVASQESADD
jgi:hypothetical protein